GLLLRLLVAVLELVEQRLAHRVGAPAELQVAAVAERHGARLDGLPAGGDIEVEVELRQLARAKTRERAGELERDRAGERRQPLRLESERHLELARLDGLVAREGVLEQRRRARVAATRAAAAG